jgi:hypothetical protein
VSWALVIARAPWAARVAHTSVVDAAGAIYVIGGTKGGSILYQDVWISTDKGAEPDSCGSQGCSAALTGVLKGLL